METNMFIPRERSAEKSKKGEVVQAGAKDGRSLHVIECYTLATI